MFNCLLVVKSVIEEGKSDSFDKDGFLKDQVDDDPRTSSKFIKELQDEKAAKLEVNPISWSSRHYYVQTIFHPTDSNIIFVVELLSSEELKDGALKPNQELRLEDDGAFSPEVLDDGIDEKGVLPKKYGTLKEVHEDECENLKTPNEIAVVKMFRTINDKHKELMHEF